ncbi:helix-turn-helix domain-containing protein [Shivajiella indica]|uniref:Helix-turn-helix domain-containing protein n=1 Tax=Shivajiella indica TaxID=872115 RepID=A0ABW5BGN4_9BACT
MDYFGELIRELRKSRKLSLKQVSGVLEIDQGLLSKIERGKRNATKAQVIKLASFFNVAESDLLVKWMSDKLLYQINGEMLGREALSVAEEKAAYIPSLFYEKKEVEQAICNELANFSKVKKAWIFGSFTREDNISPNDVDLAIEAEEDTSYFDLADIKFVLERLLQMPVDIGFYDSIDSVASQEIKKDLRLIYER